MDEIVIFTDEGRNLFNEKFLPFWKFNRRKHLSYLVEKKAEIFFTSQILEKINKIVFNLFERISEFTKVKTICLKYMDSDFYPALYRMVKEDNSIVYLVITRDKDFFHLVNKRTHLYIDQVYDFEGMKKFLMEKHDLKKEIYSELLLFFYPLFHALIGDQSDNIKPLVKHRGLKHWIKVFLENSLHNIISSDIPEELNHPKWEAYNIILQENFLFTGTDLKEREKLKEELFKRLIILDFDITSLIILRAKYRELYEKLQLSKSVENLIDYLYRTFVDQEVYKNININDYFKKDKKLQEEKTEEFLKELYENFSKEFQYYEPSEIVKALIA